LTNDTSCGIIYTEVKENHFKQNKSSQDYKTERNFIMNITIANVEEITGVRHCLRNKDKRSLDTILEEMNGASSELVLMALARQMVNTGERNQRIDGNENNIRGIKEVIKASTNSGDIINSKSCYCILSECKVNDKYATANAIYEAIEELAREGYLIPKRVKIKNRYEETRYINAYEVR
jgi:hypothetical protein